MEGGVEGWGGGDAGLHFFFFFFVCLWFCFCDWGEEMVVGTVTECYGVRWRIVGSEIQFK